MSNVSLILKNYLGNDFENLSIYMYTLDKPSPKKSAFCDQYGLRPGPEGHPHVPDEVLLGHSLLLPNGDHQGVHIAGDCV